jgi:hypothetical protein
MNEENTSHHLVLTKSVSLIFMKRYFLLLLTSLSMIIGLNLKAENEQQWLIDAKLALGDDLKEKFRAKDRLKDLDHLNDLLQRELKGPHQKIVLDLIKELKVRPLLLDLKNLSVELEDKYIFNVLNSLTTKEDVKLIKAFYRQLKKKGKKSSFQGYLEFYDLYNQFVEFSDLAEMYQEGDSDDKDKVAEYLILKIEAYEPSQVSFFVNTALNSDQVKTKIILMSGLRRLPDPEIKKFSIKYKSCEKDGDKILADLCHRLWLYSEKKSF